MKWIVLALLLCQSSLIAMTPNSRIKVNFSEDDTEFLTVLFEAAQAPNRRKSAEISLTSGKIAKNDDSRFFSFKGKIIFQERCTNITLRIRQFLESSDSYERGLKISPVLSIENESLLTTSDEDLWDIDNSSNLDWHDLDSTYILIAEAIFNLYDKIRSKINYSDFLVTDVDAINETGLLTLNMQGEYFSQSIIHKFNLEVLYCQASSPTRIESDVTYSSTIQTMINAPFSYAVLLPEEPVED